MKLISKLALFTAIFIVLFSINVSSVSALDVTDVQFSWANVPIEYVSQNNPIAANIVFSVSPADEVVGIGLDASDMNNDIRIKSEYSDLNVPLSACNETQAGVLSCKASNLVLRTSDNKIDLIFKVELVDGSVSEVPITVSLTFDNTKPKVTKFGPDTCVDDKCYVASGAANLIKIVMDDSLASFVRKKVAFRLQDETAYVHECQDMTCMGYATPLCTDGRDVPLVIVQYNGLPSQDDAGNALTGLINTQVICDDNPPVILSKSVKSSSGLNVITNADEAIVEVNVTDTVSPKINMTVIGDDVGSENVTVECVKHEDYFTCKANIKPQTTSYGAHNFPIKVTDLVGNVESDQINFDLYGSDDSNTSNVLWKTDSVSQSSSTFIRRNMAYQRSMFAEVSISPLAGNPSLVKVEPNTIKCVAKTPGITGSDTDVTDLKVLFFNETSNKIYTKITYREGGDVSTGRYSNITTLEHDCSININSRRGNTFYSKPQVLNFTVSVDLTDAGSLDSFLQREIDSTKSRIEEQKKLYDWYDQTLSQVISVCKLAGVVETTYSTMSGIEEALSVALITKGAAAGAGTTADQLGMVSKMGGETFIQMCKYATCQGEYQQYVVNQLNKIPYANDVAQWTGMNNFSDSFDPYKSEYIAIATGCIPAWIHHQKVKNGIECTYLSCLSDGVPNYGTSVSYCQSQKAFSECVYNYGALFNAIPGLNLVRDAFDRIANIIKDPYTLFGTALPFACMALPKGDVTHATCNLLVSVSSIPNIIASYSGIFQPPADPASQCGIVLDNLGTVRRNALIGNYPEAFEYDKNIKDLGGGKSLRCGTTTCDVYQGDNPTGTSIQPVYDQSTKSMTGMVIYQNGRQTTTVELTADAYDNGYSGMVDARIKKFNIRSGVDVDKQINNGNSNQNIQVISNFKDVMNQPFVAQDTNIFSPDFNPDSINDAATKQMILDFKDKYQYLYDLGIMDKSGAITPQGLETYQEIAQGVVNAEYQKYNKMLEGVSDRDVEKVMNQYLGELATAQKEYHAALKQTGQDITNVESSITDLKNEKYVEPESGTGIMYVPVEKDGKIVYETKSYKSEEEYDDLKEKSLDNLNDYKENLKESLDDKKDEIQSAQNKIERSYRYNAYFGSLKNTVRTAWGVGSGLATLRDMFNADWSSEWYDNLMGPVIDFFGSVSNMEYSICESDLAPAEGGSNGVILNAEPSTGFTTGAFITGRKSALQTPPNGEAYREYWLDGGVAPQKDGLTFKVLVYDENGGSLDVTYNVTGSSNAVTFAGSSTNFGGLGRSATFKSPRNFNKVCIQFNVGSLREYFDFYTMASTDNKLCQSIVGEE